MIAVARWLLVLGTLVVPGISGSRAGDEDPHAKLAAKLCDGLAARMTGDPAQPFIFRSFEPFDQNSTLHPALENSGFTYDNALAVMALYACGRRPEAKRVADALVLALYTDRHYRDGRLRNAYRSGIVIVSANGMLLPGYWSTANNAWLEDGYQVGSATGSTAWGALALLTAYDETNDPAYLDSARTVMAWVDENTEDPDNVGYFGGFFGGEPTPDRMTWKSTEHNLDVYAANRWLAGLDPSGDWKRHAELARLFLDAMWDEPAGHFYIGSVPGSNAPNTGTSGLDSELWPLIAVPAYADKARRVLEWTERNHGVAGGFDFNEDRDGIWLEGTAQAALVFRLVGQEDKAGPLFDTISTQIAPDGLVYATNQEQLSTGLQVGPTSDLGDFKYYRLPHIGATAWAVLAGLKHNPFLWKAAQLQRPL
ncbi:MULTISPECIES: hypothetical protein [unclassified Rhizobium]|uniref:hypothetical protein n=1 Tax=unclassified Rhizobium TaxID=2613769 RepID=UPI000EA91B80|nr:MULTISPECIES: hypothetical protein [unclassified Rhizobium]AYG70090.1 hypothetical protein CCGE531_29000 [Rhizobium sp. CCGE531]AYG76465.1 hypothetical protein CCGE532_28475 [Rhizobium sp. CCGE532]